MPSPKVERDLAFSRLFDRQIKRICGEYLLAEAPFEEDTKHATDLLVLRLEGVRIACRIRRHAEINKRCKHCRRPYRDEFTIRSWRPKATTELAKIRAGWGSHFFYGFGIESTRRLTSWTLADLKIFRDVLLEQPKLGCEQNNRDGSSDFKAYRWDEFPPEFIVEQSWRQGDLFGGP